MDGGRAYPISANVFIVFCLVLFLVAAAASAYVLLASLREGLEDQAWMSALYFAVAAPLAAFFWWLL